MDPFDAFLVETWATEIAAFNQPAWHTSLTTLARAGLHDQALDGARLIADPAVRCSALIGLVAVLQRPTGES